ncbi:MAG: type IV pilus modification protein PilV [Cellvibrionaceae bacterium]|nr:type IV pilus modification protein PilV [Cellvibrionaceae bacterium]
MSIVQQASATALAPAARNQRGATLMEVLVALFLMAIGLLGMLSLQNSSQRSNQSAMFSSTAVVLARDMANRIMANDDQFDDSDNGRYANIDTASVDGSADGCSNQCDGAQILNADVNAWAGQLRKQLPAGRGRVDINATGVHIVTVMWDDQLTGADGTDCGGNPKVDLSCVKLEFRL